MVGIVSSVQVFAVGLLISLTIVGAVEGIPLFETCSFVWHRLQLICCLAVLIPIWQTLIAINSLISLAFLIVGGLLLRKLYSQPYDKRAHVKRVPICMHICVWNSLSGFTRSAL